jgi:hypothetical protein
MISNVMGMFSTLCLAAGHIAQDVIIAVITVVLRWGRLL